MDGEVLVVLVACTRTPRKPPAMSSRVRRERAVAKSETQIEQVVAEPEVDQEETNNPVSLSEEPISLEPETSDVSEPEPTVVDDEEDADEEDDVEQTDFSSLFARASDELEAESSAPQEDESVAPELVDAVSTATSSVRRRRAAAPVPESSEPSAASPAATPKSNVSGGRFAALKGKVATPEENPKPAASKFSALKGKTAVVRKSILEDFEENVMVEGAVTIVNRLLPNAKAVAALSESDYVRIRDVLCWIAGMSPVPCKSKKVVSDDSEYHSVVIRRDSKSGSPTHAMVQGNSPVLFMLGEDETELLPSTPGEFPGFSNEVISESPFEMYTFELNPDAEGQDLAAIIRLIVDLVTDRAN